MYRGGFAAIRVVMMEDSVEDDDVWVSETMDVQRVGLGE